MADKLNITDEVVKAENRYLTKVVALAVTALISTAIVLGKWQVQATKDNKEAIHELTKVVVESTVSNNNRFNQLDNRINLGREKGSAIVNELKRDIELIWKTIEEKHQ